MEDMPRPRPKYLQRHVTRHGKVVWYVKKPGGPKIRILGEFGSPAFNATYDAAISGDRTIPEPKGGKSGTIEWLVTRYRDSSPWRALSPATRRQRDNIFLHIIKSIGGVEFASIRKKDIAASRDARRATPFAAGNFLLTMRGLFDWALQADLVKSNPTDDITAPRPPTEGFLAWTEADIEKFERRWPIGTRERLALAVLLYTGLRRGDAARLGRPHVRDGVITLRPEKTGFNGPEVTIPMLPELARIIAVSPTGELTFISTLAGRPMAKESFGNWFHDACRAAGVRGSAHGLRKAGATRAANNGATVAELEAIFGWSGGRMASLYTRNADRKRLARMAMGKMSAPDKSGTSIVPPDKKVGITDGKE